MGSVPHDSGILLAGQLDSKWLLFRATSGNLATSIEPPSKASRQQFGSRPNQSLPSQLASGSDFCALSRRRFWIHIKMSYVPKRALSTLIPPKVKTSPSPAATDQRLLLTYFSQVASPKVSIISRRFSSLRAAAFMVMAVDGS
jgi:hypothetical protein